MLGYSRWTGQTPWKLYNAGGHGLDAYRAAAASLDTGANTVANVVVLSASDGDGYAADEAAPGNNLKLGFVGQLNSAFASRWQDTGIGFIHSCALPYGGSPWTFDSNWAYFDGGFGIGSNNRTAQTAGAVSTLAFNGTGVAVNFTCGSSTYTFDASVDGVSKGSFNTNQPSIAAKDIVIAAAGSLANGPHTLTLTTTSPGIVMVLGATALTPATRGMRMIRACVSGSGAGPFVWNYAPQAAIDQWNPALTVIALLANDAHAGTPAADFKTYTQLLITRAKLFGSVLLYADWPRPDMAADASDPCLAKYIELSNENDVPLIDMVTPLKGRLAGLGLVAGDGVHPNLPGHNLLAKPLLSMLL